MGGSTMAQLLCRRVRVRALLGVALALPLPRTCYAQRESPNREHVLPITVESGFWAREKGEVVAGGIPPDVLGHVPNGGWQVDAGSVRVSSLDGVGDVPFRLLRGGDGRPERLAFRLVRRLLPLSSARYALRFRSTRSPEERPGDVSAPGADFDWPDDDSQLMQRRNGDFEQGDAAAAGWSLTRGEVCTENPCSGRRCIKLSKEEVDPQIPALISQPFPISPDCRYTLKLRARGVKIGEEGTLMAASFYFLDADKHTVKTKPFRVHFGKSDLPNAWTTVSGSEAAPPETRYGQVRILIYRARGTLWVDDVEVIRPVSAQRPPAIVRFTPGTEPLGAHER